MFSYLKVSDLALVESVEVEFHSGLNVLTGETGAGKTVLIGAIGLLLGDRGAGQMVRAGSREAVLEASFDLSGTPHLSASLAAMGYIQEDEQELTLTRRLPKDGKSRCTVNGRLCPVSACAAIGDILLEVHGQNTHQALLKRSSHIDYLDRYAGADHVERLKKYRSEYERLRALLAERKNVFGKIGGVDATRESELLSYEIAEIDASAPVSGELESLDEQASRLKHSSELWELASKVEGVLRAGEQSAVTVVDLLSQAALDLSRMTSLDASLSALSSRFDSIALESEDLARDVAAYRDNLDTDPLELEKISSRLTALRELCRKYGGSLEAALDYRCAAASRLEEIRASDARASAVDAEIDEARESATELAKALSEGRLNAVTSLERDVASQMSDLDLESARFAVEIKTRSLDKDENLTGRLGSTGCDSVEFLFAPASEVPPAPLTHIASGGEMSRVMLALKIVLAGADRLPVLVFDEVDAGIGGETAASIGKKLRELTEYHQVFCVTHLPQIASFADWQYGVFKTPGDAASTEIALLGDEERVAEICRMLGDSSGRKVTCEHARDILKRAGKSKRAR